MTGVVDQPGRAMTPRLQAALDNVPASARHRTILALQESDGALAPLFEALAVELRLVAIREADLLHRAAVAVSSGPLPGPPIPPRTGPAAVFDPERGTFTVLHDADNGGNADNGAE